MTVSMTRSRLGVDEMLDKGGSMGAFSGRTALVTGGGRGLGRAVSLALAREGARVVVMARSIEQLRAVTEEIKAAGGQAIEAPVDLSDPQAIEAALGAAEVDVAVNNAGIIEPLGVTAVIDRERWERVIEVNLVGAFRVIRTVLPGMLTRSYGRIVNISSGVAAGEGLPRANAYSVSKAGLEMLTRNLALELRGSGVTINAVRPGVIDTEMQATMRGSSRHEVGETFLERFVGLQQRGELLPPEVPAELVVRLLATKDNGQIVHVRDASRYI